MDAYTVPLDPETELYCTIYLFAYVQNIDEVRLKVLNGELSCAVVKAALVVDVFQILVAANKAAVNEKMKQLTTKSLYTELLYNLSMSKNISRSLIEFGINDRDKNIVVAQIHKINDEKSLSQPLLDSVKGERIAISRLSEFSDHDLIRKTYKIDDDELTVSNLADSVVSRISCKECILLK
nr:EKC/KEOPS complex subunit TPRKB-like [Nomia melanderi]